jgi:hypothetical protein
LFVPVLLAIASALSFGPGGAAIQSDGSGLGSPTQTLRSDFFGDLGGAVDGVGRKGMVAACGLSCAGSDAAMAFVEAAL